MILKIKNLGQVKEATLGESNLRVIVGDNGTGKTLLLETEALINNHFKIESSIMAEELYSFVHDDIKMDLNWKKLYDYIRVFRSNRNASIQLKCTFSIDEESFINEKFYELTRKTESYLIEKVNKEVLLAKETPLEIEFVDLPDLIQQATVDMEFQGDGEDCFFYGLIRGSIAGIININEIEKMDSNFANASLLNNDGMKIKYLTIADIKKRFEEEFKVQFLNSLISSYFAEKNILFLPSERNLFMDNAINRTLYENSINRSIEGDKDFKLRYSEHLFNKSYLEFKNAFKRHGEVVNKIISHHPLEPSLRKLFEGRPTFDENGEFSDLIKDNGQKIKRELFSTKQNRLIPYVLIMDPMKRYKEIIIEEPEAHLSLKSIRQFIGFLKELLRKDYNVTLTTHSDVFFTHLNNFILNNSEINVTVYELKNIADQSTLEEKTKGEDGYEIDLFSKELDMLFEDTLDIQKKEN
ncbi:hypothetical protein [Bacillus atrophaeus]|uniref:hypothetical protein n=1 Tax=Bacillus atrophaeus TaxID=1452 RepID=UPI00077932B7|nr:hypothetical protein [Bacillus atrophaeus]KYD02015.1 hypothetical protein B4144_2498 [Bacillus atrophaeus]